MPEIKRAVQTVEVNYVCDQCQHGMMQHYAAPDPVTKEVVHRCMICGHEQMFKGISYPRIDYIGVDERF